MISVTVDVSRLTRAKRDLAGFPEAMARAKKRALEDVGQAFASRAKLAFRTEALRPARWAPRKPSKNDDGHPLLIRSGALRQSIGWRLEGADAVAIGTDKKYAAHHQHGTKKMPARPFFPIDGNGRLVPEMERKVVRAVERAVGEALGRPGAG